MKHYRTAFRFSFLALALALVAIAMSGCSAASTFQDVQEGPVVVATDLPPVIVTATRPAPTRTPIVPTADTSVGTLRHPYPLGDPAMADKAGATAILTVTNVARGAEAWSIIHAENQFNSEPGAGAEYVIVTVHALAVNTLDIDGFDFSIVDSGSVRGYSETQGYWLVLPGSYQLSLLEGGEDDLVLAFEVGIGNDILLLVGTPTAGIFFALTP